MRKYKLGVAFVKVGRYSGHLWNASFLKAASSTLWTAYGDMAGLHVAIDFHGKSFGEDFKKGCLHNGISVTPVENHSIEKGKYKSMLLIGYGHLEPEGIRRSVAFLLDHMNGYPGSAVNFDDTCDDKGVTGYD